MITRKINNTNRSKCTGCFACASVCPIDCIEMISDNEGFWYPAVNESCIECGKCIDVCHIFKNEKVDNHPIAYACKNTDEEIRSESSSGGVFYELAAYMLSQKGVVFGAGYNANFEVVHTYVENIADLKRFQRSKYVQSKIGNTFKQAKKFLLSGRNVLFSGTPCQIAGLKSFLGKPYDSLTCVDFICHGVPSPLVWKKYIEYQEKRSKSRTQKVDFRVKDEGWRRFSVRFIFENHTKYQQTLLKDLYMNVFLSDICLRPSCYHCDFKTLHRQSDITLADFWGVQFICPEIDDNKGTSLVFVNSKSGIEIFDSIMSALIHKEVEINLSVKYNPSAIRSSSPHPDRAKFLVKILNTPFNVVAKEYCMENTGFKEKVSLLIYSFLEIFCVKKLIEGKSLKISG